MSDVEAGQVFTYERLLSEISGFLWEDLTELELESAAWAYYYFSVQFRENLEIACALFPEDIGLQQLMREECNTDNLSPYPGVTAVGERINHDEFMLRILRLSPMQDAQKSVLAAAGQHYLDTTRSCEAESRALSITSYEDGGLEMVFNAILRARCFTTPLLKAFKFFLVKHIKFDSDLEGGHGVLSRGLVPDSRIDPLWQAFRDILVTCVPGLNPVRDDISPEPNYA